MRARTRVTRRNLLEAGLASVAAWAMLPDLADAGEPERKYTVQPYQAIQAQKFAWGWIRWLMNAQIDPQAEMTVGIVEIEPNQSNPFHVHPNSAEFMHLLSGTCQQRIGEQWMPLKTGDTIRIPKGVPHMARTTDQPCRAIIIYDTGTRQMVPVQQG